MQVDVARSFGNFRCLIHSLFARVVVKLLLQSYHGALIVKLGITVRLVYALWSLTNGSIVIIYLVTFRDGEIVT